MSPTIHVAEEIRASSASYRASTFSSGTSASPADFEGESTSQLHKAAVPELLDWSCPKARKEFIRLEQRVLAGKANDAEEDRYDRLRRDRNSVFLADRAQRDYEEIRRLRKLSQALAEVQKYIRPLQIG